MNEKRQIAELARALRHQLEWQRELGADGAPVPDPDEIERISAKIRAATLAKLRGDEPAPSKTPQRRPVLDRKAAAPPPAKRPSGAGRAASGANKGRPAPQRQAPNPYGAMHMVTSAKEVEAKPPSPPKAKGSRDDALAKLRAVRDELGECKRCKLASGRRHLVFGVGDPLADLVFVGEAPGFHEDRKGEPFVGKAGQLLTKMIGAMGLSRQQVYILNIIKCRPPGNRDPEADEMAACEPFLIKQLEALEPKVIVTLGRYASQALLRERIGIKRLRGKWRQYQGIKLMPTFHPSFVLRDPSNRRPVWEDLQQVMAELGLQK